jgi:AAA domain
MTELGTYRHGFASYRRMMAAVPEDARLPIFKNAAMEARSYVAKGLNRAFAADELYDIATAFGLFNGNPDFIQSIISEAFANIEDVERVADIEQPQHINGKDYSAQYVPLVHPFPLNESGILPRDWVIPGLLMLKQVTVIVAPSGAGKSLLTIQVGIACAHNRPWAGWRPRSQFRVLFINTEDDIDEMKRRLAAAARTMTNIDQNMLADEFLIAEPVEGMVVARFDNRTKTLVRTPLLEKVIETILLNKISVVFVDPFAETFEGDENSNSELKWAGMLWREVARRTNAAVCLIHHTKKYSTGMAGDVDAARGAGALIGIARIVSTLFPMTKQEAEIMLEEEGEREKRLQYLRYDDAKANLNLVSSVAKWFRKESFLLANARPDKKQPADEVGALVPWKPKAVLDGIAEIQITEFFKRLDFGLCDKDGKPTGEFWTLDSRKQNEQEVSRYVGDFIMKFFKVQYPRALRMIEYWKKLGGPNNEPAFKEDKYRSPKTRKERSRVRSTRANLPENEDQQAMF